MAAGEIKNRLDAAVKCFDEAAVFTIHGFCHKILKENAFESGFLFDLELSGEQRSVLQEVVDDFWRIRTAVAPEIFVRHLLAKPANLPDGLAGFAAEVLRQAQLEIILPDAPGDMGALEKRATLQLQGLADIWAAEKARIQALLLNDPGLNRRSYQATRIPRWIAETESYLEAVIYSEVGPAAINSEPTILPKPAKKGAIPYATPFSTAVQGSALILRRFVRGLIIIF